MWSVRRLGGEICDDGSSLDHVRDLAGTAGVKQASCICAFRCSECTGVALDSGNHDAEEGVLETIRCRTIVAEVKSPGIVHVCLRVRQPYDVAISVTLAYAESYGSDSAPNLYGLH